MAVHRVSALLRRLVSPLIVVRTRTHTRAMSSITDIPTSLSPGELWLSPSSPKSWPVGTDSATSSTHIAVLDSSFNPPTLAHLALASAPFPPSPLSPGSSASPGDEDEGDSPSALPGETPYTARLLLFSLTNVEKKPTASDPSLAQRLHLISLLSTQMPNCAFGLINEPTFVGKSKIVHEFLRASFNTSSRTDNIAKEGQEGKKPKDGPSVKLSFIVGTDTLVRFFDPRFYTATPGGMDAALSRFFDEERSTLVSARRGGEEERELERALLDREKVKKWVDKGSVRLFGKGKEEWVSMSSTKVRKALSEGDYKAVRTLVIPEIADYLDAKGLYR